MNVHIYDHKLVHLCLSACVFRHFLFTYHHYKLNKMANKYLFSCVNFSAVRQKYFVDLVQEYTLRDLMYGIEGVSQATNENIFTRVQNYILHTKRFDP